MVKRLFQGIVLFFALYAFAFMPLGKRTALEHVQAVIGSREAKQAATELQGGATRLVQKLRGIKAQAPLPTAPSLPGSRPQAAPPKPASPQANPASAGSH